MVDTGWVIAGAGASVTGVGTAAWSNPGNVTADDGTNASSSSNTKNTQLNYLVASDFGFAIPANATIEGIEARFQVRDSLDVGGPVPVASITHVLIGKDSSTLSNDLEAGAPVVTAAFVDYDYGGAAELWGLTWSAADINASTFQALLSMNLNVGATIFAGLPQVDAIWMKVHYSVAASGRSRGFIIG
ncbi:MAG: hypothetical protein GY798_00015 [Hyphomicrobiales bacterium]|nr:hypothetical protein [Hyphomicrobiales bacterium]